MDNIKTSLSNILLTYNFKLIIPNSLNIDFTSVIVSCDIDYINRSIRVQMNTLAEETIDFFKTLELLSKTLQHNLPIQLQLLNKDKQVTVIQTFWTWKIISHTTKLDYSLPNNLIQDISIYYTKSK